MRNKDVRWPQGKPKYHSQSRRRRHKQNFDLPSSYSEQEEPYDRMAHYGAEHTQDQYDYESRERSADRYRSDHDLNISLARYDNDQDYHRDFINREKSNRSHNNRVMNDIKSFFGFGPKNYRRSDERIREDICEALTYDHDLDATHIDVTVKDTVVTLTGTVPQRSAKRLAEDIAEKVRGVSDIRNEIQVKNVMSDDFVAPTMSSKKNSDHLI